jgi:transcription factor 1
VDLAKFNLPPIDNWQKYFPTVFGSFNRVSLRNPETAARLANAFIPKGSRGKVVIEAYPGGLLV